ncbi:MAG: GMP reductase [Candidimonas sp.]
MHVVEDRKLDFKDVLIRPRNSSLASRSEVDLTRNIKFPHSGKTFSGVPIMASNMTTVGTIEMADKLSKFKAITVLHKFYDYSRLSEWLSEINYEPWLSVGLSDEDFKFIDDLRSDGYADINIAIDVANGYMETVVDVLKKYRDAFPKCTIMVGNVVTGDRTAELIKCGADIVRVGIGNGSACTTRKMAGVGYPQLSAIDECAMYAHAVGGYVCADGGCVVPGDVAKAFGAGADFVMLGGMLAGHDESGGEIVFDDGKPVGMEFYGMSSKTAMERHYGGMANYRASEGKTVVVPYRGSVETTMQTILGGLRSCCTYVDAKKIEELSNKITFIKVGMQTNDIYGQSV